MADTKLSALVELAAAPAVDDEIYIRDVSEAAATESKRITYANLVANQLPNRNAIINGGMDVWQRGTTTLTNPASGVYFPDRFKCNQSLGDGTFDLLNSAETPAVGFPFKYSLKLDCTHIETAVAAGEYSIISYFMEGVDFLRFEGETATLSFWVKAVKTGIYCVSFRNAGTWDKSYVHEFTVNAASTWEKKTVTLTFDSGGTFAYDTTAGLAIAWATMAGSTFQTATANKDTWQAGSLFATDAQVNGLDSTDNNFWITGVQFELGSVATPFENKPYQQELALCQRYCYGITTAVAAEAIGFGYAISDTVAHINIPLPVTMRTVPTLTATAADWQMDDIVNAAIDVSAIVVGDVVISRPTCVVLKCSVAAGFAEPCPTWLVGDGTTGRILLLTAEL